MPFLEDSLPSTGRRNPTGAQFYLPALQRGLAGFGPDGDGDGEAIGPRRATGVRLGLFVGLLPELAASSALPSLISWAAALPSLCSPWLESSAAAVDENGEVAGSRRMLPCGARSPGSVGCWARSGPRSGPGGRASSGAGGPPDRKRGAMTVGIFTRTQKNTSTSAKRMKGRRCPRTVRHARSQSYTLVSHTVSQATGAGILYRSALPPIS